jgi:hypothetical protein
MLTLADSGVDLSAKFELWSVSTWPMRIDCTSFLRRIIVKLPNSVEHAERRRSATSLHGLRRGALSASSAASSAPLQRPTAVR